MLEQQNLSKEIARNLAAAKLLLEKITKDKTNKQTRAGIINTFNLKIRSFIQHYILQIMIYT